jgi:hypothetical protein
MQKPVLQSEFEGLITLTHGMRMENVVHRNLFVTIRAQNTSNLIYGAASSVAAQSLIRTS